MSDHQVATKPKTAEAAKATKELLQKLLAEHRAKSATPSDRPSISAVLRVDHLREDIYSVSIDNPDAGTGLSHVQRTWEEHQKGDDFSCKIEGSYEANPDLPPGVFSLENVKWLSFEVYYNGEAFGMFAADDELNVYLGTFYAPPNPSIPEGFWGDGEFRFFKD